MTAPDTAAACEAIRCSLRDAVAAPLIQQYHAAVDLMTDEIRQRIRERGREPDDPADGFRFLEACQRGPGRLDMRHHRLDEPPFAESGRDNTWMPLVTQVLGDDSRLLWRGVVVTEPGTPGQLFHADGAPLPPDKWPGAQPGTLADSLPAHCLTVFVPLVTLTSENGPTTFLPGTHRTADTTAAEFASARASAASTGQICEDAALISSRIGVSPVSMDVAAGDAIIFDYRVFHAGAANRSMARRPILYFVYARSWFTDEQNFPGPEASLFSPMRLAEAALLWEEADVW